MKSETNPQNDGGFIIVLLIILVLILKPSIIVSQVRPDTSVTENLYFHVSRFYGAKVDPNTVILEKEIERAADAYGLQRNIFKALVKVESGGNPYALSPVGARGVAQIMPFNARRCGLSSPDKLWDAVLNLRCGAQILSEELREHGSFHAALTVYNCGRLKCPAGKMYASKVLALSKKIT